MSGGAFSTFLTGMIIGPMRPAVLLIFVWVTWAAVLFCCFRVVGCVGAGIVTGVKSVLKVFDGSD